MVRITVIPPGPPGRRVQYFLAKSRHRTLVPLMVIAAVLSALSAWLARPARQGTVLAFAMLAVGELVLAALVWRKGQRQAPELTERLQLPG